MSVHLHPNAVLLTTFGNVQGTFQLCAFQRIGLLTLTGPEGVATVELGTELADQLLALMPQDTTPPKVYA